MPSTFFGQRAGDAATPRPASRLATVGWHVAILLLVAVHGANNWLWTGSNYQSANYDDQTDYWDGTLHLRTELRAILHDPEATAADKAIRTYWLIGAYKWFHWSRLTQLVGLLSAHVFGYGYSGLTAANNLWTALLLFSTFWLGRRMSGPAYGFLAACLVGLWPGVDGLSRNFGHHYAAVGMSALCLHLLLRNKRLESTAGALLLGVACGAGILANPKIVFYLAVPFAFSFYRTWRTVEDERRVRTAANFAVIAATAALVSASWWLASLRELGGFLRAGGQSYVELSSCPSRWSWPCLTYYGHAVFYQLSPVFFLVVLGSLALFFAKRGDAAPPLRGELAAWFFGSFALLTAVNPKNDYYVTPLLAPLALIVAAAVARLPFGRAGRAAASAAMIVFGAAQALQLSWGFAVLPAALLRPQPVHANDECRGRHDLECRYNPFPALPSFSNDQTLAYAAADRLARRAPPGGCKMIYPLASPFLDYRPRGYFKKMLEGLVPNVKIEPAEDPPAAVEQALAADGCAFFMTVDDDVSPNDGMTLEPIWQAVALPSHETIAVFQARAGR